MGASKTVNNVVPGEGRCFLKSSICLCVCSASSREGSNISAIGPDLFYRGLMN